MAESLMPSQEASSTLSGGIPDPDAVYLPHAPADVPTEGSSGATLTGIAAGLAPVAGE